MLMADTMAIFLVILGLLLAFPALWLVWSALFGDAVERAGRRIATSPIKSLLAGGVLLGLTVIAAGATGSGAGAAGQVVAVALVCLYILWAHLGVAGLAAHIGRRLPSPADAERPWKATLRGGIALELCYLLPVLGWLGLLPLSWIIGAGAATLGLLDRAPAVEHQSAPEPALDQTPVLEAAR